MRSKLFEKRSRKRIRRRLNPIAQSGSSGKCKVVCSVSDFDRKQMLKLATESKREELCTYLRDIVPRLRLRPVRSEWTLPIPALAPNDISANEAEIPNFVESDCLYDDTLVKCSDVVEPSAR